MRRRDVPSVGFAATSPVARGRRWIAGLLALVALVFALPALAAGPTFPPLTGRVVDDADILSPAVEAQLTTKLEALEKTTGRQLVVATLPDLQGYEIEDYGYQLGRAWGVGQKGTNTGALLIVAPNERRVRIEVGYGLEPILTDALSSVIIQTTILPKFKAGDLEGGVVAGTDAVIQQLALPDEEAKAKAEQAFTAHQAERKTEPSPILTLLVLFVIIVVLSQLFSRRGRGGRRGGGLGSALPWIILNGMLSGGRGGGGGGSFGGGGGGGFSGGGGSFGGGGSSGSW